MNIASPTISAVDNKRWMLDESYSLTVDGVNITIHRDFVFDGASIPRFFWRFIGHPMQGKTLPASLIHDALYRSHLRTKEDADLLFLKLMRINDVGRFKSRLMYSAVKYFGGRSYYQYKSPQRIHARLFVKLRKVKADVE